MNNQTPNIAVLDDDLYFRTDMARGLRMFGTTHQATSLKDYLNVIEKEQIDVAFLDLDLTTEAKKEGLEAIEYSLKKNILPVVLTGHEDKETIKEAYKLGAAHYFSKADFQDNYQHLVKSIFSGLDSKQWDKVFANEFITRDQKLQSRVKFLLEQSLDPTQNIMILGPTGVGKSKLAKLIHDNHDSKKPFVHVNLSEIPENLLESQLFGHKRGAFTGATNDHAGIMAQANGGTLFLDEIGTLPINVQKKLLRVLEDKTITPLGSQDSLKVDFRLITATCDDLSSLVEQGDFRLDLYFRIKGIEVLVPALKKRRDDILPLVDFFINQSSKKIAFSDEAELALTSYDWFGNIRELQNLVKELLLTAKGLINLEDLPEYIVQNQNPLSKKQSLQEEGKILNQSMRDLIKAQGLPALINQIEKECLQEWKLRYDGKTNEIIRQLKISKSLYYRIESDLKSDKISSNES